jgi:hypothetical protein
MHTTQSNDLWRQARLKNLFTKQNIIFLRMCISLESRVSPWKISEYSTGVSLSPSSAALHHLTSLATEKKGERVHFDHNGGKLSVGTYL